MDTLRDTGARLPSLRYVTNSGGKIPPRILEDLPVVLPGVDIFLMYGLTEAFRSTYLPPAEYARYSGIGFPSLAKAIRICRNGGLCELQSLLVARANVPTKQFSLACGQSHYIVECPF